MGGPHIPPSFPGAQGRTTQRPQRASAEVSGAAWVRALGFLGPSFRPETPPKGRSADAQPTGRFRESAARLSQRLVDGVVLAFGQGPAVKVGYHHHLTQHLRVAASMVVPSVMALGCLLDTRTTYPNRALRINEGNALRALRFH